MSKASWPCVTACYCDSANKCTAVSRLDLFDLQQLKYSLSAATRLPIGHRRVYLVFHYYYRHHFFFGRMRVSPRALFRFVAPKQGQPMAHPYTYTARWSQWNVVYEFRNNWTFRYTLYGMALVFPFICYIDSLVNSPAAKAAYKKAKQAEKEKEHEQHMWADISGRYAKR